jgi:hypothetical protein
VSRSTSSDCISYKCKFVLAHVPGQDLEKLSSGEVIGCDRHGISRKVDGQFIDFVGISRGGVSHG